MPWRYMKVSGQLQAVATFPEGKKFFTSIQEASSAP